MSASISQQLEPVERIPPEVAHRLGYYVYLYVDPRNGKPFYVGKGQDQRILAHLSAAGETRKAKVLAELAELAMAPHLEILAHALPSEEMALRIEAAIIDLLGLDDLTNLVSGWRSIQFGRMPLSELVTYYAAKPVTVTHPALLIRINRLYRHGMSPAELYEATRGVWKLSPRRQRATYALAVFEGVVREVYEIHRWHPAGTLPYHTRVHEVLTRDGRWEFEGAVASEPIRNLYVDSSVASYFKKGLQSPVVYVNC
jgi:uncharacterized protein